MEKQNRKRIKTVLTVLIIALIIGTTIISTSIINALVFRHTEGLVYRTETGDCYHSPDCSYLWHSAIPIGEEQAKDFPLRRCSRCQGTPEGTIVVDNYGSSFAITLLVEMGIAFIVLFVRYKICESKQQSPTNNITSGDDPPIQ